MRVAGRTFSRLPLRRAFTPNRIHALKHRNILSLVGIAGIGAGLCLAVGNLQTHANCAGGEKTNTGPKIKIIQHVSDLAQEPSWKYVVLGCGTAAWATVRAISKNEPTADILMVSPHQEVPETKDIKIRNENFSTSYTEWRRHVTASIPTHYGGKISLLTKLVVLTGQPEYHVDPDFKEVLLADGSVIKYGKLCIASTGKPRNFHVLPKTKKSELGGEVVETRLNVLEDIAAFERLQEELDLKDPITGLPIHKDVAVVGGGFLGTEIALGSLGPDRNVTQIYAEKCLLDRYVPSYLAMHVRSQLGRAGVKFFPDTVVEDVALERRRSIDMGHGVRVNRVKVNRMGTGPVLAHYVTLASTHIVPDIRNADHSGFEIDEKTGGIKVNRNLEIIDGIFVAGNACSWFDVSLGRRRVNQYDHAKRTGEIVGYNMSSKNGNKLSYKYQPGFRSEMSKIGVSVNGIGIIDSNLKTVGIWCSNVDIVDSNTSALDKGIVYYIQEGQTTDDDLIVGCLLWNATDQVNAARTLLSAKDTRRFHGLLSLKTKINLGPTDSLNIMIEKKNVLSVSDIIKKKKEEGAKKEKLHF